MYMYTFNYKRECTITLIVHVSSVLYEVIYSQIEDDDFIISGALPNYIEGISTAFDEGDLSYTREATVNLKLDIPGRKRFLLVPCAEGNDTRGFLLRIYADKPDAIKIT